uniref:Uncharacterized protein n=1 Tax=Oryza sativa subsp. japonica TaxID=39947 RepID=Q6F2X6_ORYSJ|nr:unknown protein [Oryza sativa Japonica Group]
MPGGRKETTGRVGPTGQAAAPVRARARHGREARLGLGRAKPRRPRRRGGRGGPGERGEGRGGSWAGRGGGAQEEEREKERERKRGSLMGRKGFFGPCGGELDMAKPSFFELDARGELVMAKSSLFGSLRHGFRQIWSKGLMTSANKPLTGKGESGASAETVQTMWYGGREQYWAFL